MYSLYKIVSLSTVLILSRNQLPWAYLNRIGFIIGLVSAMKQMEMAALQGKQLETIKLFRLP